MFIVIRAGRERQERLDELRWLTTYLSDDFNRERDRLAPADA
jgi:hypothetical protein